VSIAVLALTALVIALAVSMTSRLNVGWFAIAFAWLIGVYGAGMSPEAVVAGFPVSLFITLAGVTLLFAIAETNGTLARVAERVVGLARGNGRVVPLLFFVLSCVLASVGPGAISTVALVAPLAMAMSGPIAAPPLLTALMVANGANAGNLSPFSSVGIIANGAMARSGLSGHEGQVWFANFAAHVVVAAAAYMFLSRAQSAAEPVETPDAGDTARGVSAGIRHSAVAVGAPRTVVTRPLAFQQSLTLVVIAGWIAAVLGAGASLGLSAFAGSALLLVMRAGDDGAAVRRMPWGIIMMVCGVSVLIGVLEKTGGMELFTSVLARIATPSTINGTIAFVTGAISTYSSTSGVVLPAFLPAVPSLVQQVGGGDPLAVALSINVGASLVDVSPLSTLGALCVAAADPRAGRDLFRGLMIWGVSMTVVGALLCQLFIGLVARAG
jgi:Na+/H+ antiporter NhaD/arsenite permease-like protein